MNEYIAILAMVIAAFVFGWDSLRRGRGGPMTKQGRLLLSASLVGFVYLFQEAVTAVRLWGHNLMAQLSLWHDTVVTSLTQYACLPPSGLFLGFGLMLAGLLIFLALVFFPRVVWRS